MLVLSIARFLKQARSKCSSFPQNWQSACLAGQRCRGCCVSASHQEQGKSGIPADLWRLGCGLGCCCLAPLRCDCRVGSRSRRRANEASTRTSSASLMRFRLASSASCFFRTSRHCLIVTSFSKSISFFFASLLDQPWMSLSVTRNSEPSGNLACR